MVEISVLQILGVFAVIGILLVVLPPYLPPWASYGIAVAVAAYYLLEIILDGPTLQRVTLVVFPGTAAALLWWRFLRGTERAYRQRCKPPPRE
jgi:membrane protein implicated in regulation of membrane protease activity